MSTLVDMELERFLRNLLYRLESIDDESKSTITEDKANKLSHQIDQLKSDLSDVASLFHLLKDNKERLTVSHRLPPSCVFSENLVEIFKILQEFQRKITEFPSLSASVAGLSILYCSIVCLHLAN